MKSDNFETALEQKVDELRGPACCTRSTGSASEGDCLAPRPAAALTCRVSAIVACAGAESSLYTRQWHRWHHSDFVLRQKKCRSARAAAEGGVGPVREGGLRTPTCMRVGQACTPANCNCCSEMPAARTEHRVFEGPDRPHDYERWRQAAQLGHVGLFGVQALAQQ